jgi:amidase
LVGRRAIGYDAPMSEPHRLTLLEVADALAAGATSSVDLTRHMLERIARLDPTLRAYATVTPEVALAQAAAADAARERGAARGPLHGVPIAVKDLCATRDAPTRVGGVALGNWRPGVDATVVARLRAAGAVMLGKLQMTEGAFAAHHPSIAPPVNPWHGEFWPGVSSSGSGVATAAELCFAAIGTDTGGSIRFPAHACGVTGLKPTWGRVSRAGVFPLAASLDHVGAITRSAADAAAFLGVIAGRDPADPTTLAAPVPDYRAELGRGLAGLRVGVDEHAATVNVDPAVTTMLRAAADVLAGLGATIVPVTLPDASAVTAAWVLMCAVECALAHETTYPAKAALYGPTLAALLDLGRSAPAEAYARGHEARLRFAGDMAALFTTVDLVLAPAQPIPTPPAAAMTAAAADPEATEQMLRFTAPFDMSGSPTLSLPGGVDANGLPLGFQLVGPALGEPVLLRAGHAYQQATEWHRRRPPLGD